MKKVLTIVVPAYNMQEYLDRCLSSLIVKEKVAKYLDIIIINDGSKDATLRIAKEYANKSPELFRVIDKKNGNWGSCVNVAAKEAIGKYFLILDADDWLETKELELFIEVLQNGHDVDLFVYNCLLVRGDRKKAMFKMQLEENKVYQVSEIKNIPFFIHCIVMKTSIIQQIHLTEGIPYCDIEINIYMFEYVQTLMIFNKCLYNYVIGRLGQTVEMSSYLKNLHAIVRIYKRYCREHSQNECVLYWQRKAILPLLQKYYQVNLFYNTSPGDYETFKEIDEEVHKDSLLQSGIYEHSLGKVKYVKWWSALQIRSVFRVFRVFEWLKALIKSKMMNS